MGEALITRRGNSGEICIVTDRGNTKSKTIDVTGTPNTPASLTLATLNVAGPGYVEMQFSGYCGGWNLDSFYAMYDENGSELFKRHPCRTTGNANVSWKETVGCKLTQGTYYIKFVKPTSVAINGNITISFSCAIAMVTNKDGITMT